MPRELRPRFEVSTEETADVLLARIGMRLRAPDCPVEGYLAEQRVVICLPPARRRMWSAELRADVTQQGVVTVIEGRYAPHAHVWVTFVIILAAVGVGITADIVFAFAQWSMSERPVALYGLVPLLLIGAATYAMAFIGQRFATEEMDELHGFLAAALESDRPLQSHIRNLRPVESEGSSSRSAG